MRLATRLTIGGGLAAIAVASALVAGGVFAPDIPTIDVRPTGAAVSADSLSEFESCPELLSWYVDNSVREVGPWGWDGGWRFPVFARTGLFAELSAGVARDAAAVPKAQGSSATGTNTREADVDEPDIAKTNGEIVVRLVHQRRVEISDVTGDSPRLLGSYRLPARVWGNELLLVGNHVLVSSSDQGERWGPLADTAGIALKVGWGGSRIIDLDISDPAEPRVAHDDTYSGRLVSLRQYGETIRVVTAAAPPELPWVTPERHGPTRKEARQRNRALVRETTIEDWLPTVRDNLTDRQQVPLDCTDVYHPREWAGTGTVAVTTYDVGTPDRATSVGVTAPGDVVYSSADRLYVTSTRWVPPTRHPTGRIASGVDATTTRIHAFALDGTTTRYAASGHINGSVRDQWSMDEHDGRLRVAWTRDKRHTRNGVTVLQEYNGALIRIGRIGKLGWDEEIQSVRWFDDMVVLVTFREMDPLYTVDLSDAAHPRALGALKMPGYSAYLHPIGPDQLLGLGVKATRKGRWLGTQAAVFDVSDLTAPRRVSGVSFGKADLAANSDPHAFTWLPDRRSGVTLVTDWTGRGHTKAVALKLDPRGNLNTRDLAENVPYDARALMLPDGRIALAGGAKKILILRAP